MMSKERFYVGIGASAGGLEALSSFFSTIPATTGATFIVVQHLSPDFKSLMDELLSKYTTMKIYIAKDGMKTEPNSIYLIPPRSNLTIVDSHLYLEDYQDSKSLHLPIDIFFESLASDQKENAIAVVLSGTGSDGSRGIKFINQHGGLVIVQSIESARFDGMPRNALASGVCDFILQPEKMSDVIVHYMKQPSILPSLEKAQENLEIQQLKRIGIIMNVYSGIDFNMYKSSTILRRIERRIKVNRLTTIDEYIQFLLRSDKEKEILKNDFLIGVTGFFRDNGAFDALSTKALDNIDLTQSEIRIWVTGCSTGEEAYSIAIRLQEFIEQKGVKSDFKLFATDINPDSIEVANIGLYASTVAEGIPENIIHKYFEPKSNGFRITDTIRKKIVFAKHNLLLDPPFSKLDLIVCRNVLIYIKAEYQENIIRQFYRSLNPEGILFLGSSESLGTLSNAFHIIDKKWNIFKKDITNASKILEDGKYLINYRYREPNLHNSVNNKTARTSIESIMNSIISVVIEAGILIDNTDRIIHIINDCSPYLQPQPGKFTNAISSNIKKEYLLLVNNIIRRIKNSNEKAHFTNVKSIDASTIITISGNVVPSRDENYFLLTFTKEENKSLDLLDAQELDYNVENNQQIVHLEKELSYAKETLQATVEELETSNEELQSSNEELIASNEELQSTNEELQSVNEELFSVNNEYQTKIDALIRLNNDINNLLINTEVAAIYLDRKLRIRKVTPLIYKITNIIDDDLDRPIKHITVIPDYPNIYEDIESVHDTLVGIEREVKDSFGKTWYCRIKPYRKEQNIIDGIVITFIEITNYIKQLSETHITSNILEYVQNKAGLGWFHYNLSLEEFTTSGNIYTLLEYSQKQIPKTLSEFFDVIAEYDRQRVTKAYMSLIEFKNKSFDIEFGMMTKNKKTIKVRQTAELIEKSLIGTSLIIKD